MFRESKNMNPSLEVVQGRDSALEPKEYTLLEEYINAVDIDSKVKTDRLHVKVWSGALVLCAGYMAYKNIEGPIYFSPGPLMPAWLLDISLKNLQLHKNIQTGEVAKGIEDLRALTRENNIL